MSKIYQEQMSNLTAVSLFAGVGGFDLAMQRNGIEVVAAVEIDKKCREVLSKKFPNTKLFEDVKGVSGEQLRSAGFIPERGILTGGFPCQDLSVAGLRKGLAGERSGLFHQIIRLVDELEPHFLVLENVPGLLSSQQGKDMGIIITALVERRYGICWRVLDSQNFGVPQRRKRVFIVASLGNHRQPVEILFESEGSQWDLETITKKRKRTTSPTQGSIRTFIKSRRAQTINDDETWLEKETVSTLNAFDVGDTRTTTAIIQEPTLFQGNRVGDPRFYDDGISPTVMSRWGTGGNNVPIVQMAHGREQSNTIPAELYHHGSVVNQDVDAGHLVLQESKAFNMRSDAIANNMTVYETDQTGSVTSLQPSPLTHRSQTLIVSPTLTSYNLDSRSPQSQEQTRIVNAVFDTIKIVRRLTPKECERLQGFPDDWTAGQADSNRYKQMGNAVTVNVVDWIMKRLVKVHE